jgi:mannose-6-phosphate isomerase-like protein (cupin superfamily)
VNGLAGLKIRLLHAAKSLGKRCKALTMTKKPTWFLAWLGCFKDESLEAHRHLQPETYYVLSGKGKVTIEHVEYDVEADTMVYIPGDALHQINNYDDEPLRILYLFATPHFSDVIYKF